MKSIYRFKISKIEEISIIFIPISIGADWKCIFNLVSTYNNFSFHGSIFESHENIVKDWLYFHSGLCYFDQSPKGRKLLEFAMGSNPLYLEYVIKKYFCFHGSENPRYMHNYSLLPS